MDRLIMRAVAVVTSLALLIAAFAGGFIIGHARNVELPQVGIERSDAERQVAEVRSIIKDQALKPASEESMTAGAISGLLESLDDDYAMYFNPKHYAYFNEQNMGEFYGIGVTIAGKNGTTYVVSVIDGTPAAKVGLKADDVIVGIDGVKSDKWDTDEVVKRIRGPEGTKVKVEVARKGEKSLRKFDITRAKIDYPNIETRMIGKDIGFMALMSFNAKAAAEIEQAIEDLSDQGAKGFILDLRNNPGGMLDSSIDVSSLFVKDGVIVRVDKRSGPEEVHRANGNKVTDAPLVVLVNENSASASEIVAGALQDYKRAVIVGVTTFGKGSVQTVEQLDNGGAVKFTIAHYLTPKKRVINHKGVSPDVVVKMKVEDIAEEKTDVQLKRAVEELRKLL